MFEILVDSAPAIAPATRVAAAVPGPPAVALPEGRVSTEEIAAHLGVDSDWAISRTGVRSRRVLGDGQLLSGLATAAGAAALARAGVDATELDMVLVATVSADELTPATAALVAAELGSGGAAAIDVGAACTGFVSALSLATGVIESGRAGHVLVIGADALYRYSDRDDRGTAALFGDAAGALVLSAGDGADDDAGFGPFVFGSDGALGPLLHATHDRRVIEMDGPEVYRHAVDRLTEVSRQAAGAAGVELGDIDLIVPHQANTRITAAVTRRLGADPARVVDCISDIGNVSAASIPVALSVADADGRLVPGARVLLAAFGAGLSWGAVVARWGPA